jgi:hypothetical protein
MAAKRSERPALRAGGTVTTLIVGEVVETDSRRDVKRYETIVEFDGEHELGPDNFPVSEDEPGFAVRFRQRLLEAGREYPQLLNASGAVHGRLSIVIAVSGPVAESWYQDADQWMLEAAKGAVGTPGLAGHSTNATTGVEVRAEFRAAVDKKLLAPNEEIGKDADSTVVSVNMSASFEKGLQSLLHELAGNPVADFNTLASRFQTATHVFRTRIAELLEGPLNDHLRSLPQETPSEKQALATWVNAQLRTLGLAVRCPKTGRPSALISDVKESGSRIGRFRTENRDENGLKVRPWTSTHLPLLELLEDDPRLEPLVAWTQRAKRENRRER